MYKVQVMWKICVNLATVVVYYYMPLKCEPGRKLGNFNELSFLVIIGRGENHKLTLLIKFT